MTFAWPNDNQVLPDLVVTCCLPGYLDNQATPLAYNKYEGHSDYLVCLLLARAAGVCWAGLDLSIAGACLLYLRVPSWIHSLTFVGFLAWICPQCQSTHHQRGCYNDQSLSFDVRLPVALCRLHLISVFRMLHHSQHRATWVICRHWSVRQYTWDCKVSWMLCLWIRRVEQLSNRSFIPTRNLPLPPFGVITSFSNATRSAATG